MARRAARRREGFRSFATTGVFIPFAVTPACLARVRRRFTRQLVVGELRDALLLFRLASKAPPGPPSSQSFAQCMSPCSQLTFIATTGAVDHTWSHTAAPPVRSTQPAPCSDRL